MLKMFVNHLQAYYGVPSNTDVTELIDRRQFQGTSAIIVIVDSADLLTHSGRQVLSRLIAQECKLVIFP